MWRKRAHTLAPLTKLCSTKFKFKSTDVENNAFIEMKKIVGRDVLISYPNFNEKFIIHANTSNTQIGGIIIQNGKPIYFYSRKLTPAQINYTTTEKITVKYNGKPKIFPYNYCRTPYDSIYGPQKYHI